MTPGSSESPSERWRRRALVIPAYGAAFVVMAASLPGTLPVALALDLIRDRRFPVTRLVLFGVVYLGCEVLGLVASLGLWLATLDDRARMLRWHYALQTAWGHTLFMAACRLFGLRLAVEGDDAVAHGRFLLFSRHVSLADTLLPVVLVTRPRGVRLRWVMKRELLWDPCLDVVGQRLPNVFVRRGSDDGAREIAALRDLARDLGPEDGILIYPEGTRSTPAKRARARDLLAAREPERAARLAGLQHVLPPRSGGPLALLDAQPSADVVFMAHAGLDGAATLRDVLQGRLIGRTIEVAFWRVSAADLPHVPSERLAWLDAQWLRIDEWVQSRTGSSSTRGNARRSC